MYSIACMNVYVCAFVCEYEQNANRFDIFESRKKNAILLLFRFHLLPSIPTVDSSMEFFAGWQHLSVLSYNTNIVVFDYIRALRISRCIHALRRPSCVVDCTLCLVFIFWRLCNFSSSFRLLRCVSSFTLSHCVSADDNIDSLSLIRNEIGTLGRYTLQP